MRDTIRATTKLHSGKRPPLNWPTHKMIVINYHIRPCLVSALAVPLPSLLCPYLFDDTSDCPFYPVQQEHFIFVDVWNRGLHCLGPPWPHWIKLILGIPTRRGVSIGQAPHSTLWELPCLKSTIRYGKMNAGRWLVETDYTKWREEYEFDRQIVYELVSWSFEEWCHWQ
jgi:hypothetical protein